MNLSAKAIAAQWGFTLDFASKVFKILIGCIFLAACSSHRGPAPVVDLDQPPTRKLTRHVVAPGETLYSIAWRYGLDYRNLARANKISAAYNIYPGQILNLRTDTLPAITNSKPQVVAQAPAKPVTPSPSKTVKKPSTSRSNPLTNVNPPVASHSHSSKNVSWRWPAPGPVVGTFSNNDPNSQGIAIATKKGESVVAAADGTVVYAGEGLRGYGKLLIIKHSKQYLSAYAHADQILVSEGKNVQAGQKVAEIGSSGAEKPKLYFEVRKDGDPVNPLRVLPNR